MLPREVTIYSILCLPSDLLDVIKIQMWCVLSTEPNLAPSLFRKYLYGWLHQPFMNRFRWATGDSYCTVWFSLYICLESLEHSDNLQCTIYDDCFSKSFWLQLLFRPYLFWREWKLSEEWPEMKVLQEGRGKVPPIFRIFSICCIFLKFIFNWKMIALQYCVGLCHTSPWINLKYICPLPKKSPSHLPPHPTPLGCHRAPDLSSLQLTTHSHWLSLLHMVMYMLPYYSLHSFHPLLLPHQPLFISLYSMSASPLLPCK